MLIKSQGKRAKEEEKNLKKKKPYKNNQKAMNKMVKKYNLSVM